MVSDKYVGVVIGAKGVDHLDVPSDFRQSHFTWRSCMDKDVSWSPPVGFGGADWPR